MLTLSGVHTIGKARCSIFRSRLYNESNMDSAYATPLKKNCPSVGGDDNLSPLDGTDNLFDTTYFKDLVDSKGLLYSDQVLFNNASTDSQVQAYSVNSASFFSDFRDVMVKMGNLGSAPGTVQEIRSKCKKINTS
ncbi:hypothetical protein Ddye_006371 [Dipteronia dyeriana]|uniref:peroxidase n=1 Tax=Dipteronia dyeriana TaxID=168575 RepID=A0AAD9XIC1_9ROSI|nr:hypothetical protein Ddye_006371 [Dipteronia dyeriana]